MHGGFFLKIFLVMAGLNLLMDWYVFNGLKTFTAGWRSARRRRMVRWGYLVIAVGITVTLLLDAGSFSTARGMTPVHEWVLSLFLTFFFTKIFFIVVLFLGDIGRFFYGVVNHFVKPKSKKQGPFFPTRRKFISEIAIFVAAVPFTSFLYAMFKGKYDYKLHKETIYFDDLPDAFDGFTITQVSDIHSGSFDNTEAVQRGIDLAKAQKATCLCSPATWSITPPGKLSPTSNASAS